MALRTGQFDCEVLSTALTTSGGGTPGMDVIVVIPELNEEVTGTIWLTVKAAGMAKKQFKALGVDFATEDLNVLDQNQTLRGRKTVIELGEDTYLGRTKIKVRYFGDGRGEKPSAEAVTAAQAALRAAKDESKTPKPKAATTPGENGAAPDDDTPPF